MNWTRGLLRLWVVASIAWAAFAFLMTMDAIDRRSEFSDLVPLSGADIAGIAAAMIMPPIGAVLAFLILRWVWRGFRT